MEQRLEQTETLKDLKCQKAPIAGSQLLSSCAFSFFVAVRSKRDESENMVTSSSSQPGEGATGFEPRHGGSPMEPLLSGIHIKHEVVEDTATALENCRLGARALAPGGDTDLPSEAMVLGAESDSSEAIDAMNAMVAQTKRRKLSGPNQKNKSLEEELCLICGDRASGYHYNALSCEGCKGETGASSCCVIVA